MNSDLELIRAFRAEDAVVDASSEHYARAALLAHIDGTAQGRPRPRRRIILGLRVEIVAVALSIVVVVSVGAAFLRVGGKPQPRPAHQGVVPQGVIRNFSPGKAPALPGPVVCTAALTGPAGPPGGVFWPTTCQFQPSGTGGSPHGTFYASSGKVSGVKERPFSITAVGLAPNTGGSVYEVWLLQAVTQAGSAGGYRLLEPQTPRLLGMIEPGVGRDGKLAAQGEVPSELLGGDYLLVITLQPHRSVAKPGRTVLHGFVSLPSADG